MKAPYRLNERIAGQESLDDPAIAQAYGWVSRTPQMRLMRRFVAQRAITLRSSGEAADLGCGPGYLVLQIARRAPGLRVTGIDLSDEMLAQGESLARQAGLGERVAFKEGDVQRTPFSDHSMDLVVSTLSLHHWSDPVAVLDEVARIMRPGGAFLIFDLRRDLALPFWLLLWFAQHVVVPRALRRVGEPMGSRNASYTPAEAAELARRSTLRDWRVTRGPLWLTIEGIHAPDQTVLPASQSR